MTDQDFTYHSMAPIVSTKQGENVSDRIWKETMEELSFADVEGVLKAMQD